MSENLQKILEIFYQICKIPHPSGKTQKLREFLIDFLRACECEVKSDSAGNIHALKGTPKLVFQAHYDMVLVGDKVVPFIENGFLKSRNSSLGADNGAAVALLLCLARRVKNIEILLTNDEEIGMLGANNLALQTQSKKMINLDSECVEEICIGCAGGFDVDIDLGKANSSCGDFLQLRKARFLDEPSVLSASLASRRHKNSSTILEFASCKNAESRKKIKSKKPIKSFCYFWLLPKVESPLPLNPNLPKNVDSAIYEFSAHNFKGGHSGIDIDKNIKNAIVELLFALDSARQMGEFEILEISGGEARNSIPINARAIIRTKTKIKQMPNSALTTQDSIITTQEVNSSIFDEKLGLCSCERGNRTDGSLTKRATNLPDLSQKDTEFTLKSAIIPYLLRLHNGIYEMEQGSVTSSLNFSIISNEALKIMVRGNKAECLERQILRLKYLFGEAVKISGFYNAWEANSASCKNAESSAESTLLSTLSRIYTKYKIPFKIIQIHAGLECGILKEKCALDEVISIGPTILHPHSKNEVMDLASFERFCAIVEDLCEM